MATLQSNDAVLYYEVSGSGPGLVLLHPFPLNHHFWDRVLPTLVGNYRVLTPDLRGHGQSELGEGPAAMAKHAGDLLALCNAENLEKIILVGVSIGGYVLFEFWRRHRERVAALVLSNTRPEAEDAQGRANRLSTADEVLCEGTAKFIEVMLARLLGSTTRTTQPNIVEAARRMMQEMSPEDIAGVQRGMSERPDSVETLAAINVPSIVIAGSEDSIPPSESERMSSRIGNCQLHIIQQAGHYAAMEKPEEYSEILLNFAQGIAM